MPMRVKQQFCSTKAEPVHTLVEAGCLHFKCKHAASMCLVIVAQSLEAGFGL